MFQNRVYVGDFSGMQCPLHEKYVKNTDGFIFVYDVNDMYSLHRIEKYYFSWITEKVRKGSQYLLLGNKTDLKISD